MNKKIKSLLISGLLSMVLVFPATVSADSQFVSTVTNPSMGEWSEAVFQNGAIVVDVSTDDNYEQQEVYSYKVLWNPEKFNVDKIIITLDDGYEISTDLGSEHRAPTEDSTEVEGFKSFSTSTAYEKGKKIKEIKVEYSAAYDENGNGVPDFKDDEPVDPQPPVEPEEPEVNDPETGDSSIMVYVGATVASVVGLYVVNKKKDNE